MDNQIFKMLGIDQGTRFVFCCGQQIDLWTELRVKKWSKNTFLGGLDPVLGPKFPGPLGFFRWRVNISKWAKKFVYRKLGSLFPGNERNFWPKKIFGSAPPVSRYFVCSDTTPEGGGGGGGSPLSEGVSFALTKERLELSDPPLIVCRVQNL